MIEEDESDRQKAFGSTSSLGEFSCADKIKIAKRTAEEVKSLMIDREMINNFKRGAKNG